MSMSSLYRYTANSSSSVVRTRSVPVSDINDAVPDAIGNNAPNCEVSPSAIGSGLGAGL